MISSIIMAKYSAYNKLHVHHFFLGWSVAIWAEFNHPVSALTLAIAMGVFSHGALIRLSCAYQSIVRPILTAW